MRLTHSQKSSLAKSVQHYQAGLGLAEEYLAKRGISQDMARAANLGVVHEPLPGHEQFRGRLVIPYMTPTGPVDIRFRALGPEEPKYMGLAGAKTRLYNVQALQQAGDRIAICEGEIDTIILHYAIGFPAVGVPGANNWKPHYTRLLQDFETIYVFADGDKAGSDFAKHLAKEVRGVVILNMPEGEDVNSTYLEFGKEYFKEKVVA